MTGGLVTDITTLMVAMIAIGFLCFGIDHLKDVLDNSIRNSQLSNLKESLYKDRDTMDNEALSGTLEQDIAKARYRSNLSKYARNLR